MVISVARLDLDRLTIRINGPIDIPVTFQCVTQIEVRNSLLWSKSDCLSKLANGFGYLALTMQTAAKV